MRTMKDSGVEWIGEIPSDWTYTKLKTYYTFEKGKNAAIYTREYIGLNKGSYPVYSGQTENNGIMGKINLYDYNLKSCVFTTTVGAKVMTPRIISGKFSLSQNCLIMKQFKQVDDRFTYYLLLSLFDYERSLIPSYMQPSLRIEDLKEYSYFSPIYEVQQRIADFLDKKCGKIDEIIEREQVVIEKLKEYKQSVITEAVTKGLNSHAEMKDSGIEWIGKIPNMWKQLKLKYATEIMRGKFNHRPRNDPEYYDGIYPFVQTGDVARATKFITSYSQTLNDLGYSVSKEFPKGSICMTIAANVGDVAVLDFNACFPDSVVGFVPTDTIKWSYLYYVLSAMKSQLMRNAIISTQMNLNIEIIKEEFIPLAPLEEQTQIADYLDNKCVKIDKTIEVKQSVIDKLTEYKKSLIYEVVTGKKEI